MKFKTHFKAVGVENFVIKFNSNGDVLRKRELSEKQL